TRRDLRPAEFISELGRLQDDAPKVPWPDIRKVLEGSLGGPVTAKFASFGQEPIAAASIAQVHTATLPSGDQVVVKVRRPDVTGVVGADLDLVQPLAGSATPGGAVRSAPSTWPRASPPRCVRSWTCGSRRRT